jgi:hypothetical protein
VHFAPQPPSDDELAAAATAGQSQGRPTSDTDGTMTSPTSTATSLNDVFLPSSTSTPGTNQSQGYSTVGRQWQTSVDVIDGIDDNQAASTLVRSDTSRGSFYNNPFRHDTIDGRVRTSRIK